MLNFVIYRNIQTNLKGNDGRKEHVAFSDNWDIGLSSLKITYFK